LTNYPIQSGMTPTAGGIVFFSDMRGNFYALDAANGQRLWGQKIGGGVITYIYCEFGVCRPPST
jgi:alcohol dehydrogenase (cytochrome c)